MLGLAAAQPNGEIFDASVSGNGNWMVFTSDASNLVAGDTNGVQDIFVKDLVGGTVTRVSVSADGGEADLDSYDATISDDGEKIVFTSDSDLFDLENDFNFEPDVYLIDRDADNDDVLDEFSVPDAVRVAHERRDRRGRGRLRSHQR